MAGTGTGTGPGTAGAEPDDGGTPRLGTPRLAAPGEAPVVARLLDAFNREFGDATPGVPAIARRLAGLLEEGSTFAVVIGDPASGVALVTLRPNVWYDGPVALLDELYVVPEKRGGGLGTALLRAVERQCVAAGAELLEITVDGEDVDARRFYERHGYATGNPGQDEPQLYYSRELGGLGGPDATSPGTGGAGDPH
ncbi:GNAT family N-acetyltransferase [Sinomonas mesophila]|uniref:GNAT family N-acetyltransferase n=1 Tax=Sinomonas mesophila TaxID=1531955 RepID=UPI00098491AE